MTPPATIAGRSTGATTIPRRRSGPERRRPRPDTVPSAAPPSRRTRQSRTARAPLPARVARGVLDAPILDRLVKGSGWIPVIAIGLMGIVFMQVSMLKLNAGIGRAVESAATLERQNAEMRSDVSSLESNERIEGIARREGMVVPAAGSFRYVTARPGHIDAREAAHGITPPSPVKPGSKVTEQQATAAQGATTAGATGATTPATTQTPTQTVTPPATQTQTVTPPAATQTQTQTQSAPPATQTATPTGESTGATAAPGTVTG